VAGKRLMRILDKIAAGNGRSSSEQLCEVSAQVVGVSGAGLMLMAGEVRGTLRSTNEVSNYLEELQFTLGEGPCVDAHRSDSAAIEPDLGRPAVPRWLAFSPPALAAGVQAVFGFPLRVGGARLGALDLYRDEPGMLSGEQHADALVLADVIARWVLDAQAGAAPGQLADQLELGADFHFVVHNAAGMVSAQLESSTAEALIRLRAYAYSNDFLLRDVAQAVVDRTLRF
jgi:hypothetical protein